MDARYTDPLYVYLNRRAMNGMVEKILSHSAEKSVSMRMHVKHGTEALYVNKIYTVPHKLKRPDRVVLHLLHTIARKNIKQSQLSTSRMQ